MADALATYVEDHLAGATYAMNLLAALRHQYEAEPLGQFAKDILADIEADNEVLQTLAERIGAQRDPIKDLSAWAAEKLSRMKLARSVSEGLGTLEALELLTLGIQGKVALWRALAAVRPLVPRLEGLDLDGLTKRAHEQHARAEGRRLEFARRVLRPA